MCGSNVQECKTLQINCCFNWLLNATKFVVGTANSIKNVARKGEMKAPDFFTITFSLDLIYMRVFLTAAPPDFLQTFWRAQHNIAYNQVVSQRLGICLLIKSIISYEHYHLHRRFNRCYRFFVVIFWLALKHTSAMLRVRFVNSMVDEDNH